MGYLKSNFTSNNFYGQQMCVLFTNFCLGFQFEFWHSNTKMNTY